MINLTIDGIAVSVPKGTTVYTAAKSQGIDIPIFCYHDRMPPFGACRMCLVDVDKMAKLQTACTLEATEGMVVSTQSNRAVDGRKGILEFLLINHPLDCPICDKGGECPLQDQTLEHGPGASRFVEEKRRFKKALPLSPVLMLDRERCIICARCTRFSELIAGDHALEFVERGFKTEVGATGGAKTQSKFIGNTIKICPVGALTSQTYRFRARPWDNNSTATTCTLCPVGCSMFLDERDGAIVRTRSCENRDVNDIWLCDKGWFGYEFVENPARLNTPLIRNASGQLEEASWNEALALIAERLSAAKQGGKIAALGGDPLTVEENYLFQKLIRQGCGVNHIDHRIGSPIFTVYDEGIMPGMEMSIGECEELNFAVFFGIDLTEEFPIIWLRLKQAINKGAKVIFLGHFSPEIAPHLTETVLHAPGRELEIIQQYTPYLTDLAKEGKGALFVGRQYLATAGRRAILSELLKLRHTSANLSLNILEGRGNSVGARLAGMRPDMGALGRPVEGGGLDALRMMEAAASGGWDVLYVAGANPAALLPQILWKQAREKLRFLVVQDLFLTETAQQADVVLPMLSFVEKSGHFINIEGRVQKLLPGKELPEGVYSDAEVFLMLAEKLHLPLDIDKNFLEQLSLARLPLCRPNKLEATAPSHDDPGCLRASFAPALFDRGVRMSHNAHLAELAVEPNARMHPVDGEKLGLTDGDSVTITATAKGNSIRATIKFDELVAHGTVVMPLGFPKLPVHNLDANLLNGLAVTVSRL